MLDYTAELEAELERARPELRKTRARVGELQAQVTGLHVQRAQAQRAAARRDAPQADDESARDERPRDERADFFGEGDDAR